MIELIPAIDLINGQCVRLTKGDYDQKKVYNDNPAEVAKDFEKLGFKRLHVVDLDGAKSKHIVNDAVLKAITTETNLTVDFGGGIKTGKDIEKAFAAGARPPPLPQEIHRQGCALCALHRNQQGWHPAGTCHRAI